MQNRNPIPLSSEKKPQSWHKEPLVHFLIIGSLLFAIDAFISMNRDTPNTVNIDENRLQGFSESFQSLRGRQPNSREMRQMIARWSHNEIYYREGLRLGIDKSDDNVRSLIITQMKEISRASLPEAIPSESELRSWYRVHNELYQVEPRYTLEIIPLDDSKSLLNARKLTNKPYGTSIPETLKVHSQIIPQKTAAYYRGRYGINSDRLLKSNENIWQILPVRNGNVLINIREVYPGTIPAFEDLRHQIARDWRQDHNQRAMAKQEEALFERYNINYDIEEDLRPTSELPSDTPTSQARPAKFVNQNNSNTK